MASNVVVTSCQQCGQSLRLDPRSCLLVKAAGEVLRVVFVCPLCEAQCATGVHTTLVGPICEMFRSVGRPLIQLPPQGDLPWPQFALDDVIDFHEHIDSILEHLLEGT